MNMLKILLLIAMLYGVYDLWNNRPVTWPPGILVQESPVQTLLPEAQPSIRHNDIALAPLAEFTLRARVLGKRKYHFDRGSSLAPIDLALGWGEMSDSTVLEQLDISQRDRFYFLRWRKDPPLSEQRMMEQSTNLHAIPGSALVAEKLARLRSGQIIFLRGKLVQAHYQDGGHWKSSLSRQDTGNGACELMWIEDLQ